MLFHSKLLLLFRTVPIREALLMLKCSSGVLKCSSGVCILLTETNTPPSVEESTMISEDLIFKIYKPLWHQKGCQNKYSPALKEQKALKQ